MVAARRAGLCRPWKFEKSPISTGLCGNCAESHLSRVNAFFLKGIKSPLLRGLVAEIRGTIAA